MDPSNDDERPDAPWVPVAGMSAEQQAEMFGSIAMSAPSGVVASDRDGRIVWVNPVAGVMFGFRREELLGRHFTTLLPPESHEQVMRIREHILRGEHTTPFVTLARHRSGRTFDVSVTPGVRRDAEGQVLGTNIILRDVTDELRLQAGLSEALARSRARFDQAARPQALLDLHGRFVEVNDAACALLDRSRADLIGHDSTEVIHPDDPGLVRERLRQLREGVVRAATYTTVGLHRDGARVPLEIDITAVRDEHGRAYEFAAFARDLTELREAQRRLARQEAFFRALNRESSDATLVADAEGTLVYATPSTEQVLGYPFAELSEQLNVQLMPVDDPERIDERRRRIRTVPGARERFTTALRRKDGTLRWFEVRVTNCLADPDISGIVLNLRDVTVEREATLALRDSEARFRAIAETAQEGIIAVSPDAEILFANERLTEILDMSLDEVYALSRQGVFYTGPGGETTRRLIEHPPSEGPQRYDLEYLHPRGERRILDVSASALRTDDGNLLGTLAMVHDVTEERAAEATLRHQALHDTLTGLPNRVLFHDRLATAASRHERSADRGLAVLFVDLDDFKTVNDSHGHHVGDAVLVEVATRLTESVRAADTVARLGGDEFAVICEDSGPDIAALVASRIHRGLTPPVEVPGASQVAVRASIGVATTPPYAVGDLLRFADRAMYRAKLTRGADVSVYDGPG